MEPIYEIAYALFGAALAALAAYVKNRQKKKQAIRQTEIDDAAYDLAIMKLMSHVRQKTSVKRFMIFKGHNGGADKYASAMYADCEEPFEDLSSEYRPVQVDAHYQKMLNDLRINNPSKIVTNELPESILKRIYKSEGVVIAYLYFLYEKDGMVYYCSLATDEEGADGIQSARERLFIDIGIGKLKRLLTKKINQ